MKTTYIIRKNNAEIEAYEKQERRAALDRLNFYNVTQFINPKTGETNRYELLRRTETLVKQ